MTRIAIGLEYNGRPYCGWQSQPGGCAIQDHVQTALSQVAASPVECVAAGRTDTGVHALVQVAHFDTSVERPLSAWVRGANAHLLDTVRVRWAREVPEDFHARFSAVARRYRYVLIDEPVAPALLAGLVGWTHTPLHVEAMSAAAQVLVGTHDFTSFRAAECQAATPVRTMTHASVSRDGAIVVFEFTANAFLHHMIRNIVGALVVVGRGEQPADWMSALLQARDRRQAPATFSPAGLYLAAIQYDSRFGLPSEGLDARHRSYPWRIAFA